MNEIVHFFQLQTDRKAIKALEMQLSNFAVNNPDDVDQQNHQFLFKNTLKVQFLNFSNNLINEFDAIGITITEPQQLKVIQPFIDTLKTPIQMLSKNGGDIIIIPATAAKKFGPSDPATGSYSIEQLAALDQQSFLAIFAADSMTDDDGSPSTIDNENYNTDHDVTSGIDPSDDDIVCGQYEYIITPTNVSLNDIFFQILGLQHYVVYDDGETATYEDESRSVRISAYKIYYQDGQFWTLSIFLPDQGIIHEATLTHQIVRSAIAENKEYRIFTVISTDDLGEITTAQEYTLHNEEISEGKSRNFVMD